MKRFDFDSSVSGAYKKGRELAPDVLNLWVREVSEMVEPTRIERLIDLGAGTGRFSVPLADALGTEVFAVDPALRMLGQADLRVARILAHAEALPFPSEFCDGVFASMVVHHFDDLARALGEVRRVLKRGGVLLVRASFAETLNTPYHRFFPTVIEIERKILLTTTQLVEACGHQGLHFVRKRQVRQRLDDSYRSYAERMRLRAMSPFRIMPDSEFEAGMAKLEEFAALEVEPEAVYEEIDLLLFTATSQSAL